MSIKTSHNTFDKTWFITFTCYKWIPLFAYSESYDLVYNWLRLLRDRCLADTLSFVIMPNHVHLILHLKSENVNLNTMISNGKRFMAYEIIRRLEDKCEENLLKQLTAGCSEKERAKGQKHKVFETSFDARPIYNPGFFHQKFNYIHHNPVSGKWNLSADFAGYYHSSASFYEAGIQHECINVCDYRDVLREMGLSFQARDSFN